MLSLAAGAETFKLKYGHRGGNQPVKNLLNGRVEITSQNHGFCVDFGSIGPLDAEASGGLEHRCRPTSALGCARGWLRSCARERFGRVQLTHVNLNDMTTEGIRLLDVPAFSVQYHPEAAPGPHDARYLFGEFVRLMTDGARQTGRRRHAEGVEDAAFQDAPAHRARTAGRQDAGVRVRARSTRACTSCSSHTWSTARARRPR